MAQAKAPEAGFAVAERYPFAALPGAFRRRVAIGQEETGLLLSDGQVLKPLPPGQHTVGWSFLGLGQTRRGAARIFTSPFSLPLPFPGLMAKDFRQMEGTLGATVKVERGEAFFRTLMGERLRVTAEAVAPGVASFLEDLITAQASRYPTELLEKDQSTQEKIKADVEGPLRNALSEKGLNLVRLDFITFRRREEEKDLLEEFARVKEAERKSWEEVEKLARELIAQGLATRVEVERVRVAFVEDPSRTAQALQELYDRAAQRQETRLAARAEELSKKVGAAPAAAPVIRSRGIGFIPLFGTLAAVAAYLVWMSLAQVNASQRAAGGAGVLASLGLFSFEIQVLLRMLLFNRLIAGAKAIPRVLFGRPAPAPAPAPATPMIEPTTMLPVPPLTSSDLGFFFFALALAAGPGVLAGYFAWHYAQTQAAGIVAGVGAAMVGLLLALIWRIIDTRMRKAAAEAALGPRLDKWMEKDSLKTDEVLRRQLGRELGNAVGDLKDAKLAAYRKGKQDISNELDRLEKATDSFRVQVEGAAFGRTIPYVKGDVGRKRIRRLIEFEEDLLRQSRLYIRAAQQAKAAGGEIGADAPLAISAQLDSVRRLLTNRMAFLEGFK